MELKCLFTGQDNCEMCTKTVHFICIVVLGLGSLIQQSAIAANAIIYSAEEVSA